MSIASEDYHQDIDHLEAKIIDNTKTMQKMMKSTEATILEDVIATRNTHNNGDIVYPKYDNRLTYYQEFWKVYLLNEILISQIKDCSTFNKQFTKVVGQLDDMQIEWARLTTLKSKTRVRRTSDKIQKVFLCPFAGCGKNYGTDVSLNLHMKIKHNSGTKSQREALAKELCLAQERGQTIDIYLTFPPGYLQDFRRTFRLDKNIQRN